MPYKSNKPNKPNFQVVSVLFFHLWFALNDRAIYVFQMKMELERFFNRVVSRPLAFTETRCQLSFIQHYFEYSQTLVPYTFIEQISFGSL